MKQPQFMELMLRSKEEYNVSMSVAYALTRFAKINALINITPVLQFQDKKLALIKETNAPHNATMSYVALKMQNVSKTVQESTMGASPFSGKLAV